ncbi:dNA-3-methyladenine glycosylase I [Prevotella sp. CAG:924]|nr:dNA-3-methyladenine glycosylase I [Prevotella sp. CAG:924]
MVILKHRTLTKTLCKWKQDSVVVIFLYLDSVFKNKHKWVHNQPPVMHTMPEYGQFRL